MKSNLRDQETLRVKGEIRKEFKKKKKKILRQRPSFLGIYLAKGGIFKVKNAHN